MAARAGEQRQRQHGSGESLRFLLHCELEALGGKQTCSLPGDKGMLSPHAEDGASNSSQGH